MSSSVQRAKKTLPEPGNILLKSSISSYNYDSSVSTKNVKNLLNNQTQIIEKLNTERNELMERVQFLEERLAESLSTISAQKEKITSLSDMVSRLSSSKKSKGDVTSSVADADIDQKDKAIIDQILKIKSEQYNLYIQQNPFPIQCVQSSAQDGGRRFTNILSNLPPDVAVEFSKVAFNQIFRSAHISEFVQILRKLNHNISFLEKIEKFSYKLFHSTFCKLFVLQPQQNRLVTYFNNNSFVLQVPIEHGIIGLCAREGQVKVYQNTKDSPEYDEEIDSFLNIGTNPSMTIPIVDSASNSTIAILLVCTAVNGDMYTPEDIEMGLILSTHISPFVTSFVENLEKVDERENKAAVTNAIKALIGKNSLEGLLPAILQVVQATCKASDVELYLYDDERGSFFVFEAQISNDGTANFGRRYFNCSTGVPFHVVNSRSHVMFNRLIPEKCEYFNKETDIHAIGQPYIAVPVFGETKKPIAVLAAYGKDGALVFSPLDLASMQQIAAQIGINLVNILNTMAIKQQNKYGSGFIVNFEKPLKSLVNAMSSRSVTSKKFSIVEMILSEMSKQIKCDLVGAWEVGKNFEIDQICIIKGKNPFSKRISVPPIVVDCTKNKEYKMSSNEDEIKQFLGDFDYETHYKTYNLLVFPICNANSDVNWVILCANSSNSQNMFMNSDIEGISSLNLFFNLLSESECIIDSISINSISDNLKKDIYRAISPPAHGILEKALHKISEHIGADYFALYQINTVSEQVNLVVASNVNACICCSLSQGIIGKVAKSEVGTVENIGNVSEEELFMDNIDGLGGSPSSVMICKIGVDYLIELGANVINKFTSHNIHCVIASSELIVLVNDLEKSFKDMSTKSYDSVSAEKITEFMSKSSSPTKADVDAYSDRLFDVANLSEDDKVIMLLKMFASQGITKKLNVPFEKLTQFICSLRQCYNTVPYHNWTHACDVTQFVFSCIIRGKLRQYINDIEIFALLLASICHDVDHEGLNNAFHRKAKTQLGLLYNDKPTMEMHHCATALKLLSMPEHNILEGLENYTDKVHFYEFFISLILATDMDKHFQYIKDFEAISKEFDKRNDIHRLILAQIVIKSGDLSNTARSFDTASRSAKLLMEEFFLQGDIESSLGVEVTPMCSRSEAQHISFSQISFYGVIAAPLFSVLGKFVPSLMDNLEKLEENKNQWEQQRSRLEVSH